MSKTIIPDSWKLKKLGDVCDNVKKVDKKTKDQGAYFIYIDIGGVDNQTNRIVSYKEYKWNDAPSRAQQIVHLNDILFSTVRTYLRNIAIVDKEIYKNQIASTGFCVIRPNNCLLNPKFMFYYSISNVFLDPLNKLQTGSSYPAVRNKDVFEQLIPIPPLPEQEQIVAKIDELFSELDAGVANIKTAQEQLKVYRQSLLSTIIKKSNFISIKNIVDKLDQGWSPRCLNKKSENNDEWAIIKTSAVQHGFFNEGENKVLPTNLIPKVQHEIKTGDILITRAGPRVRVGVCCMVRKTRPKLINCDKVYRLKLDTVKVTPEYFEMVMNAPYYMRIVESMKTGINDSGLNLTQSKFLKIKIPIPPLPEQLKIVEELESRLTVCDNLEEDIKFSLARAESLRQSILKQAFEGKLLNFKGETDK